MNQEKEDELFCKRIKELAHQAYARGICVYSSFINLNERSLFYKTANDFPNISYQLWGGYEEAERRVICFYEDDSFTDFSFPIRCLTITPVQAKFCDTLTHRDYLGAVLNLSIDRSKIGDILVMDQRAYLFCMKELSSFICENLNKIKHTNVRVQEVDFAEQAVKPKMEPISGTVASVRLDAILSAALHTSRSSITTLIFGGKVFVNGREVTLNRFVPKEGDIISIRGYGKFVFRGIEAKTKKDRYRILLEKYI